MSMNPVATRGDFAALRSDVREKLRSILQTCADNGLSCRCERVGKDIAIIIAPGLSAPTYWMDRLGLNDVVNL